MNKKQPYIPILLALLFLTIPSTINPQQQDNKTSRKNYYCEYCGHKFPTIQMLASNTCAWHPDGHHKGKHKLYEGSEKSSYDCKYCGRTFKSIMQMRTFCPRHPKGMNKGRHAPAL